MEHTKGEWKPQESRLSTDWKIISETGYTLAKVYIHNGEQVANAHLISAGPDLYEACKLALDEAPWQPLGDDIKQVIRQAIAKAEGKS